MTSAPHPGDPADPDAAGDYALVQAGTLLCALPHHTTGGANPGARPFQLRRIVPWRTHTPIPGTPPTLILGVAPLGDEEGIEHVEVIVDLAAALGEPSSGSQRPKGACILTYDNGDLVAGFAADALLRRVHLAPPPDTASRPFVRAITTQAKKEDLYPAIFGVTENGAVQPWHIIDIDQLMAHLIATLHAPAVT